MTLDELYPYLSDTHDELLDQLSLLSDEEWNIRPYAPATLSIRQVITRAITRERQMIQETAQSRPAGSSALEAASLSNADLVSELAAARIVTQNYVATLAPEMLRTVRAVPADLDRNLPESNMPLSWLLWSIVENEVAVHAVTMQLIKLIKA